MDLKQTSTSVLFAIGLLCLGFTTGGVVGGTIVGGEGMGWDRLGDMLGGIVVGVVSAVILTGATVGRLTNRQRMIVTAICMAVSVALVAVIQRTTGPSP